MSECDVCLGELDGDPAELFSSKIVRSIKPKKCDECDREILFGEKYERIKIMYDREWSEFRICLLCREIHIQFACGQGRCVGNLWEEMRELVFPSLTLSSKCFQGLSVTAKGEVVRRWQAWKGLA